MTKRKTADGPVYPNVSVKLTGEDGNAFYIMGRTSRAARKAGVPDAEIEKIMNEAMSGDYDHLLRTMMKYFDVS